jgi:hypothetical protein
MASAEGRFLYPDESWPFVAIPITILSIGSGSTGIGESWGYLQGNGGFSGSLITTAVRLNLEGQTLTFSPDGGMIAHTRGDSFRINSFDALGSGSAKFGTLLYTHQETGADFSRLKWSDDGAYLFALDSGLNQVKVFAQTEPQVFELVNTINIPDTAKSMDVFSSFVAVGTEYEVESVLNYRTRIYRRSGEELFLQTTLDDVGFDALWFVDGSYLIDATTKVAYSRAGLVFTRDDVLMDNIAANTTVANISAHTVIPSVAGFIYQSALDDIVLDDLSAATIQVKLLDETASFSLTDTLVSQVDNNGAAEVFGFNWPEGGVTLTNVAPVNSGTSIDWTSDDVEQPIFGGNLTARYALLYSGTTPLVFLDFGESKDIPANSALKFAFSSGFLSLSI